MSATADTGSDVQHFDLAIIGTGSGNSILDERFDGLTVAMFEESIFGGTCINVGCIPTKMFVYAAEVARAVTTASKYGIDAHIDKVRWTDIVDRVFGRIDPIADGGERYRREGSPNVTLFSSHARFVGPRRIDTGDGRVITADKVVVASGSRATVPDFIRDSGVTFHTNDDIMRLPSLPDRLIVLGSGYIAAEFAHVFSALGSHVTILARKEHLLRKSDLEISQQFTTLAQDKWDVRLSVDATGVRQDGDDVVVSLSDGTEVRGDALLVAIGRAPNADQLGADEAGIDLHDDGRIAVDEFGRTSAEGVFALGDVSSPYQLKHVANAEARVVQENVLQPSWADTTGWKRFDHRFVPSAVFTDPMIAEVGLTEQEARDQGYDIAIKVQKYADVAYGWAMEDDEGLCKVIADRATGRLLGAHIIGEQAPTVIQPLIQALTFGQSVRDVARGQYWIHPALPEVVENALLGLDLD
ncbi:mycothione reductase [Rhodococcus sp. BP-349]|uniref:mycothione reductase n=1 Tax=unclassified Rhodococcus (in: high G+C Gram-positive bacteria) TaxID=192944 RepID=UPI001C9B2084|nr:MULTISPECIES: mycothione reductase [unclassified Rhodococcus (in: high G+C Gram-positive bacteria)]MBY6540922.1 mycothione reductase [Rhodococcus sp. BP-363]MBY6545052.1 mycothione reductase [Rhodococcus sp. BP-369]MBY6564282.1 mycothione reductase [Rhodococcus sp. BP-370]MBY6578781.1 mycothione reductase [Rhodococcus sp. BP-364]MBY6588082.1 mycothione reductase [Rhodococcus sp. BP-358]